MNDSIRAIVLGIIQGLTEFLPVSSSGHLEIGKKILNLNWAADDSMMMTVVLHFATALSTLVIFRNDVMDILRGLFQFKWNEETQFSLKIILSMIPAAFVGIVFDEKIEQAFDGRIALVGAMLVVTGLLLFLAGRATKTEKSVSFKDSIIIGIAQAIAILPGVSRSGATISTSVLLGVDRSRAARFSFLMVVPLIFGKIAKDLLSGDFSASGIEFMPLALGFIAAFLTGLLACKLMIALVRNCQLWWFSIYCFIVGIIAISHEFFFA
ncbi:MAG: undecaprenyl-diphosphate phosphatase [Planctomycetota bacterium]